MAQVWDGREIVRLGRCGTGTEGNSMEDGKQTEEVLKRLKTEYFAVQMSDEQLERLRGRVAEAKKENRRELIRGYWMKCVTAAAALAITFVVLSNASPVIAHATEQVPFIGQLIRVVTFRSYRYQDDRHKADVEIPHVEIRKQAGDALLQEQLEKTADEINREIETITDALRREFMEYAQNELGYRDLEVKSEIMSTTQDYFTLKLICYQAMASGYEENYYYTVDLKTGERMRLKDLFADGADYIARISDNIKEQMRRQMREDEQKKYWLDSDIEGMDFESITEETSFYLNEKGNVVIAFQEGDVAPMYMGVVEFEIPKEVLSDIMCADKKGK